MNPWQNAAESYEQGLQGLGQVQQGAYREMANAPMKLYQMFMDGYEKARARKMQEEQLARQNRLADIQEQRQDEQERQNEMLNRIKIVEWLDKNLDGSPETAANMRNFVGPQYAHLVPADKYVGGKMTSGEDVGGLGGLPSVDISAPKSTGYDATVGVGKEFSVQMPNTYELGKTVGPVGAGWKQKHEELMEKKRKAEQEASLKLMRENTRAQALALRAKIANAKTPLEVEKLKAEAKAIEAKADYLGIRAELYPELMDIYQQRADAATTSAGAAAQQAGVASGRLGFDERKWDEGAPVRDATVEEKRARAAKSRGAGGKPAVPFPTTPTEPKDGQTREDGARYKKNVGWLKLNKTTGIWEPVK